MRHPAFVLLTLAALTSLTARPSAAQSVRGFGEGYTDLGPVVGLGNLGDAGLAFGARFERAIKRVPSLADGVIGIEIGVNYYHYSASFAGTGYGFTYVPIGVTANYHVKTSDKRFDPFVGAGLGYSIAHSSYGGLGASGSSLYFIGRAGLRYFLKSGLALYGDVGAGAATVNLGVTFAMGGAN